jgi:methylated-DNA-[protein]-cysteine S-methyltransferase
MTLALQISRMASPLGALLLIHHGNTLHLLDFEDQYLSQASPTLDHPTNPLTRLLKSYRPYSLINAENPSEKFLAAYFAGDLTALDPISAAPAGTDFQHRVWLTLSTIKPGTTTTYGAIARAIGAPKASRAVGLAIGANPIAIIIPCHRVIGANGSLTGYNGGLPRKSWLLAHEAASAAKIAANPSR